MHFGKNIKKIRSIKKLSQVAFAEMFGLKRSSIGSYEEERAEPKLEIIIKIAKYFNISVDSLVNREITVNELYNFHLPDEIIDNNKGIKKIKGKKQLTKEISLISSNDILLKTLEHATSRSECQINLPGLNDKQIAINVEKNVFGHLPKYIGLNDIIIVQTEFELNNELNVPGRLFFVKTKNTLGIGEIKRIKENEFLLVSSDKAPVAIAEKELDYLLPVVKHISNSPVINQTESERIRKMELLINDLYNRISESD
ncbi:helix-turn-helix domain-containing protein [Ancylomarina sp. YFZ004]